MSSELVNGLIAVGMLIVLSVLLYRPRVQASISYQATVVPLANIMDVGFIVMSPIIVALIGCTAPLFMLGLCLLAIANGFAISYNIRHYETLIGTKDPANAIAAVVVRVGGQASQDLKESGANGRRGGPSARSAPANHSPTRLHPTTSHPTTSHPTTSHPTTSHRSSRHRPTACRRTSRRPSSTRSTGST